MTSNCNECGRKTPKKVYLCNPCINFDPDYSDYQWDGSISGTEQMETFEERLYRDINARVDSYIDSDILVAYKVSSGRIYWKIAEDEEDKERTALHTLTGN